MMLEKCRNTEQILNCLNIAIDEIKELKRKVSGIHGDGKILVSSDLGISLSSSVIPEPPRKEDFSGGTEKELTQTQGTQDTDTWKIGDDKCPMAIRNITDIQYDKDTHKLTFRVRISKYDRGGHLIEVLAESDLIDITEAQACPAS